MRLRHSGWTSFTLLFTIATLGPLGSWQLPDLSDRAIGHVVPRLNSLVHQQTVTSAERSVIELWLDIKLLHQNVLTDGPERLFAFGGYQKLLRRGGAQLSCTVSQILY